MQSIKLAASAAAMMLVTATHAFADEPYAVTPSGKTEAIFDSSVIDTSDKMANGCLDLGWSIISSTTTVVVCEARMNTLQSVLSTLAIGNAYSTPPKQLLRFNIAGLGSSSRVQATGWIETQMAFGQTRTQEMDAANYHNNLMAIFESLGGRFPPGTSFPNHAFLGARFGPTPGNRGIQLIEVAEGSPAASAGLQEGDIVTRLADERMKSADDLLDGLRKAVRSPDYEVEATRAGKAMKFSVQRQYRDVVEGPTVSETMVAEQEVPATIAHPLSAADELAKFAKLRDDGIITSEEFDAQKVRLLSIGD